MNRGRPAISPAMLKFQREKDHTEEKERYPKVAFDPCGGNSHVARRDSHSETVMMTIKKTVSMHRLTFASLALMLT